MEALPKNKLSLADAARIGADIAKLAEFKHPGAQGLAVELLAELRAVRAPLSDDAKAVIDADHARMEAHTGREKSWKEVEGPKLWAEWHKRSLQPVSNEDEETRWVASFISRVICGECRRHFRKIIGEAPPKFSVGQDWFAYGVGVHNAVNKSIGKPLVSVDTARAIWT